MNKTLFGLALLSFNWDNNKQDIIDSYIQLVINIILDGNYNNVNKELIQNSLIETYGIQIQLGAVETILKRMAKNDLLNKHDDVYDVDYHKINKTTKKSNKTDLDNAFKILIQDIVKYSDQSFTVKLSEAEIEVGLISFFKENDLNLLFASSTKNNESVLPKVRESKKIKYIIAKFITDLQSNDPSKFDMVLKLAKGHAIASLITYGQEIRNFSGNLNNVEIFFDAPIIFNLLGLNGESNLKMSKELIETLKKNGAQLKVFSGNYYEVIKTIEDAIRRLNSGKFDLTKSSRVLRTAVRENISSQHLQIKLNQLDPLLETLQITKEESPTLIEKQHEFQINEERLIDSIKTLYKDGKKIPEYKINQIERDVESISGIFKIRKQTLAINLKSSKAILLTNNNIIAFASRVFEGEEWKYKSAIPVCVTDVFLATILWANYPTKNENLNIRQLMSECYDIIELDNRILNKFYEDIKKMQSEDKISSEQFHLLSASNLAYNLLEHKTFNDIEEYTDRTPGEILEDLELRINASLHDEQQKTALTNKNLGRIAKSISRFMIILLGAVVFLIFVTIKIINPKLESGLYQAVTWGTSLLISLFGLARWFEWIPPFFTIGSRIEKYIYNRLKKILSKE